MYFSCRYFLFTSLFWLSLFFYTPAAAQTLPEKLAAFLKERASEKLSLITNKPYYQTGDTIIFRVSSWQNTSDALLEVQLLAPESGNLTTTKILSKDGFAVSYIILPPEIISGDYILRAFRPSGWEASEIIPIYNPNQQAAVYKTCNWSKTKANENLLVSKETSNWNFEWRLPEKPNEAKGWFLVIGSNQVYFSQEVDFSALSGKISVPSQTIPSNQVQILLAQNSGEIMHSYTLFPPESTKNPLQLTLNKTSYNCRDQVNLNLAFENTTNKTEDQWVSVRVFEQPDLLLDTTLAEVNLNKPFYLKRTLPVYNLKKILTTNPKAAEDYILVLKGQIVSAPDKKVISNSLVHLLVPATGQMEVFYSDKEGRIQVELDHFEETKPLLFRAIQNGSEVKNLLFIPDSIPNILSWPRTYTNNAFTPAQQILLAKITLLNRINQAFYLKKTPAGSNVNNYRKPALFQESKLKPTTSYDLLTYEKFSNVTEIFRELIPAVEVVKRKDGMRARLYARHLKKFYTHYPLFLIDGIPTYDVETILNIPANQLTKIDVFNTSTALAPFDVLSTGGVIALYTQNRNFPATALNDNLITVTGTAPAITITQRRIPEPTIPNFSPLVYWNPLVKTESDGSATLSFSTSDQIGRFAIEATAVTADGEVRTAVIHYVVEEQR